MRDLLYIFSVNIFSNNLIAVLTLHLKIKKICKLHLAFEFITKNQFDIKNIFAKEKSISKVKYTLVENKV